MVIDQRNAGASQSVSNGATVYTVDRWFMLPIGNAVIGQRVSNGSGGYNYQMTGAASVSSIYFGQRIESANSADMAGQTATLSVSLANSTLTSVAWTAYYANSTDNFGAVTSIASGTFTINSTLTRYSTQISIPSAATTGIQIVFNVGAQTSGTWTISNAQLEVGSSATPFERRLYNQELANCQRYLPAIPIGNGDLASGLCYSTTKALIPITFPVTARVGPTGVTVSSAGHFSLRNSAASLVTITGLAYSTGQPECSCIEATVASGLTAGNATNIYNGGSGYILFTGCEL
jgi:hypothetical protein